MTTTTTTRTLTRKEKLNALYSLHNAMVDMIKTHSKDYTTLDEAVKVACKALDATAEEVALAVDMSAVLFACSIKSKCTVKEGVAHIDVYSPSYIKRNLLAIMKGAVDIKAENKALKDTTRKPRAGAPVCLKKLKDIPAVDVSSYLTDAQVLAILEARGLKVA